MGLRIFSSWIFFCENKTKGDRKYLVKKSCWSNFIHQEGKCLKEKNLRQFFRFSYMALLAKVTWLSTKYRRDFSVFNWRINVLNWSIEIHLRTKLNLSTTIIEQNLQSSNSKLKQNLDSKISKEGLKGLLKPPTHITKIEFFIRVANCLVLQMWAKRQIQFFTYVDEKIRWGLENLNNG